MRPVKAAPPPILLKGTPGTRDGRALDPTVVYDSSVGKGLILKFAETKPEKCIYLCDVHVIYEFVSLGLLRIKRPRLSPTGRPMGRPSAESQRALSFGLPCQSFCSSFMEDGSNRCAAGCRCAGRGSSNTSPGKPHTRTLSLLESMQGPQENPRPPIRSS